jgi:hypothetical protein
MNVYNLTGKPSVLDLNSQFRNRDEYPNPNDYLVPIYIPRTNTELIDPVLSSESINGNDMKTAFSNSTSEISLDTREPNITNYYKNKYLKIEISSTIEYRLVTKYFNKTATLQVPLSSIPPIATLYTIISFPPHFSSHVLASDTSNGLTLLNKNCSRIYNFYSGNYFIFTNGYLSNKKYLINKYIPDSERITFFQDANPGEIQMRNVSLSFHPYSTGVFTGVTLKLSTFDVSTPTRTLKIEISSDLDSPPLFSATVVVPSNLTLPSTYFISLVSLLQLTKSYYTMSIRDISPENTGYVYFYLDYIEINTLNGTVYIKYTNGVVYETLSSVVPFGYTFIPDITGYPSVFRLSLSSYDTSGTRQIAYELRSGNGIGGSLIYTNVLNVTNRTRELVQFDLDFSNITNVVSGL